MSEDHLIDYVTQVSDLPLNDSVKGLIARLADGSMRDAQNLLKKLESGTSYEELLNTSLPNVAPIVQSLILGSQSDVISSLETLEEDGFSAVDINKALIQCLAALLKGKISGQYKFVDSRNEALGAMPVEDKLLSTWTKKLCSLDKQLYGSTRSLQANYLLQIAILGLLW